MCKSNAITFNFGASESPKTSFNDKYSTIYKYIADMQAIESNRVSEVPATNTKVMITKFRKIYYNSTGWNRILVPDTEDIAALPESTAKTAMVKYHETLIPDGETTDHQPLYLKYDAAHIFAILDATNHNGVLSPLSLLSADTVAKLPSALKDIMPAVYDRQMASGWLGDLSEIVGAFYLQNATTTDDKQTIIDKFGAYYKNLANVDGMVIANTYKSDISATAGKKVSDLFVDYYGTAEETGEREKLQSSRYKTFAKMIKLNWSGSEFTNSDPWVKNQKENLRTCAAFYLAQECLKKSDAIKQEIEAALKADMDAALKNTLLSETQKPFAQFLKNEIDNSSNELENDVRTLIICFLMWIGYFDAQLSMDALLNAFVDGLTSAIEPTTAVA